MNSIFAISANMILLYGIHTITLCGHFPQGVGTENYVGYISRLNMLIFVDILF
jgi:hypothetical protein